jgi:hypothetical protein
MTGLSFVKFRPTNPNYLAFHFVILIFIPTPN